MENSQKSEVTEAEQAHNRFLFKKSSKCKVTEAERSHSWFLFGYIPKRSKGTHTSSFTQIKLIIYNNQTIKRTEGRLFPRYPRKLGA